MSRIGDRFEELKAKSEKALICFLTAGDPNIATTKSLALELERAGADILELGAPFSDPLADGPSIQEASQRALKHGTTVGDVLALVADIRRSSELPIVLMTYTNPIVGYGFARFGRDARAAGVDGVIITDMPPEEADEWKSIADANGLDTIFLLAPTSPPSRIELVAAAASGFIYCVSRTGVTGARKDLPIDLQNMIPAIRGVTDKPIAVGFGVSNPEHVRQVCQMADGAVVGSALVNLVAERGSDPNLTTYVGEFVRALKASTRG
ncbi:MAG: tryptophan synthase subunit alpha [Armatimonadota bacterium]|nr:tryptophan synthase subunit alpha [Armatimonadota bacterium]